MATATIETIRSRLERLTARVQAARETIRQPLLDNGDAIIKNQREMEQALEEALREGMERTALLGILTAVRSQAEGVAERFRGALAIFEGDPDAEPTIKSQLRQAEDLLARVRALEAQVAAPVHPFDESRLPPAPDGGWQRNARGSYRRLIGGRYNER
jgi:DNA repair exonuclease SbcCD ATPase subunit